ncbi:hypothetical protein [Vreelandella boliviensis]|uniref:HEAT repeat domain-containing protein n=1 Tax=Vreelandella boliviensis LC1 TaxID=1072583 RepID=A0A265E1V8_9GAMM|nr:hypothetical protein [Halomonas boliviensis]EHJ94651.1 hypothetical protein KUC_1610 [Halomonas boliviensis LC1]OZT75510.1 hypothetical protein CE457_03710 [Halomonas boliviensis LC1]
MKHVRACWMGLLLAFASFPLMALDLASLEAAQERAGIIDRVRNLLADDSASVRMAVFEEVMKGSDPLLRNMAMETAMLSDDERLQTAGLRQLINSRDFIVVEIVEPTQASQAQAYTYSLWRELTLTELKIDTTNDQITGKFRAAAVRNNDFVGQLDRGGLRLELKSYRDGRGNYHYTCGLAFNELSGTELAGMLSCFIGSLQSGEDKANGNSASLPARIRLS